MTFKGYMYLPRGTYIHTSTDQLIHVKTTCSFQQTFLQSLGI